MDRVNRFDTRTIRHAFTNSLRGLREEYEPELPLTLATFILRA
jgi:hypothetical protein